jgi:hypothetical protein
MAKKKVYRFFNHCQGRKKEQRVPNFRPQSLPWQRCSLGAQVAPQRCPTRSVRSSAVILPHRLSLAPGRFFGVRMVGFSL